jgi:hypothetical protein
MYNLLWIFTEIMFLGEREKITRDIAAGEIISQRMQNNLTL